MKFLFRFLAYFLGALSFVIPYTIIMIFRLFEKVPVIILMAFSQFSWLAAMTMITKSIETENRELKEKLRRHDVTT